MAFCDKPCDIYIVGAQCTGKTTVVKALKDHFNERDKSYGHDEYCLPHPIIITEVARSVLQEHSFTANDITSSPARALALQNLILQSQLSAERDASGKGGWFISDRSGADPIVYARKYVSEGAARNLVKSAEWSKLGERMRQSLVIVCEAGANWLTDDGVRLMPENKDDWVAFHQLFCRSLDEWGVKYEVLPCSVTGIGERVSFVVGKWKVAN
jgi:nicotinamide riboside kinase